MTKLIDEGDTLLSKGVYTTVLKLRRIADSFERDGMKSSAGVMREAALVIMELETKLRRKSERTGA
jgi:hypothetical protein